MPTVYVTRRIPENGPELLREHFTVRQWDSDDVIPRDVLLREVQDADGLLSLLTEPINDEVLDAAPNLKVVANLAVGFDNFDVPALTKRGVVGTNTPEVLTDTTADLAWTLMMAAARRIVPGYKYVVDGHWKTWGPLLLMGQDIHHATLGLVGVGRIGAGMARRAQGFSMRVLYYDVFRREGPGRGARDRVRGSGNGAARVGFPQPAYPIHAGDAPSHQPRATEDDEEHCGARQLLARPGG